MASLGSAWRSVRDRFRAAGLASPELDARLLAEFAFGCDPLALLREERSQADPDKLGLLDSFAKRRLAGEPVARITGRKEFYGLPFDLDPATLVPRPETEMLVDKALEFFSGKGGRLLDLGTGTGAISIAVLANNPLVKAIGVDLSQEALVKAKANAELNGVADRLELRHGSWFEPVTGEKYDLIVSNPPYIESALIQTLSVEVREFDPCLALDGGPDGLEPYRVISAQAKAHLGEAGMIAVEIGSEQGLLVSQVFANAGFKVAPVEKDLNGLDRVVLAHHLTSRR